MLARFTNRVLSGTIFGGFEPRPSIELFRLLKVPRIAPMRFFLIGGFVTGPTVVGGFAPRSNPLAPRSTSYRSVWVLVGPPLPAPIGPSFRRPLFYFMFGCSLVRVSRTSYCGARD